MEAFLEFDLFLFGLINDRQMTSWLDRVMVAASSDTCLAIGAFLVFFWFAKTNWSKRTLVSIVVILLIVAFVDSFSYYAIKPYVNRIRPCKVLDGVRMLTGCAGWQSFPSNHAANAMAFAASFYFLGAKRLGQLLIPLAFLVGFSRVYVGVHYPSDVLGGFLLGALASGLGTKLFLKKCPVRLSHVRQ
ncbi:MAG: phosphatase PAP2 family protein [Oligoflexales bacterium]